MVERSDDRKAAQDRRLRLKSQEERLKTAAVKGAGLSPWEAEVLVEMVDEVFYGAPSDRPLAPGQMRYICVGAREEAGKPVEECEKATVVLTMLDGEDFAAGDPRRLRQRRIVRLVEEARDQGGLLSQEDLARLMACDVRTIRRDVRELRVSHGLHLATRGQQKDIGPGVTHRDLAVRLWLEGHEPLAVARRINHTLHSVERYIGHFCRVVFLAWKGLNTYQIALGVGISTKSTQRYVDLYHQVHRVPRYRRRLQEVEIVAGPYYEAEGQKRGFSPSGPGSGERGRT